MISLSQGYDALNAFLRPQTTAFYLKKKFGLNSRDFLELSKRKGQSCEVYQRFWKFLSRNFRSIWIFPQEFPESSPGCFVSVGNSLISILSMYFPGDFRTYHSSLFEVFGIFQFDGNIPRSTALYFPPAKPRSGPFFATMHFALQLTESNGGCHFRYSLGLAGYVERVL